MTLDGTSPTAEIDAAIGAVARAANVLRDLGPSVDPADVSSAIAAVRELCWRIDSLTTTITATYRPGRCLAHDHGDDPVNAVTVIVSGLTAVREHLANLDRVLGDLHNHAARLYTPPSQTHR